MTAPSSLSRLLRPESIAIVGLSADSTKHGARVLSFLRRFGFEGTIWGVNPKTPQVAGVEVFAHLGELPFSPDALVLAVPAPVIPKVLEEAGVCGAGGAILFSGGFAEAGPEGAALQARVKEMALASGVRLLGPNSAGVIHPAARTVMSFLTCLERPAEEIHTGPVGLITQSGGVGSFIHNLAASRGSGLAISVSTGNEADIEAGEALSYLTDHPDVKVIALFLEVVRNGPRFLAAARAALGAGKPIVACKIGRSESGQRIMSTHTGALAGPERVYEAAFVSLGITVTRSPEELFEVAELMARSPRPAGAGVGIVTHSGGTAVMLADRAEELGVSLPTPSPQLQERLAPFLQFGATGNPADLGGIVTQPQRYAEGVRLFLEDPAYAAVVAVSTPHPPPHTPGRARALVELSRNSAKPVINLWLAGDQAEEGLHILREAGAPV
ncbi:MAG: CoA-binding protein, partial [bacterium]